MSIAKRIHPSLAQLSINTTINNLLSHNRDLGDIEITLLIEILNECTADQLSQIEKTSSKRRDLCSVTDGIWNRLYVRRFGARSARQEIMMMKLNRTPLFNWRQIFYMKLKEVAKAEKKSKDKIKREMLKEATVGKLKKSFKQIKKAYTKIAKDAVFGNIRRTAKSAVVGILKVVEVAVFSPIVGIIIFTVVLSAAVVTDLILGVIIVAMSPIIIPISLILDGPKCDSTF